MSCHIEKLLKTEFKQNIQQNAWSASTCDRLMELLYTNHVMYRSIRRMDILASIIIAFRDCPYFLLNKYLP